MFIDESGRQLRLPKVAISTALVFFHRFFTLQSFTRHSRFDLAVACIFLASKVEESAKKLQDVITECHSLWNVQEQERTVAPLNPESPEYDILRLQILKCERMLLHTISFDLSVEHPYKYLIDTVKAFDHSGMIQDGLKKEFAQRAVGFLNDSFRTNLCIQYPPSKIASAAIYLAAAFLDIVVPASQVSRWDERLNITEEELRDISSQMLEVYTAHLLVDLQMEGVRERLVDQGIIGGDARPAKRGRSSSTAGID